MSTEEESNPTRQDHTTETQGVAPVKLLVILGCCFIVLILIGAFGR